MANHSLEILFIQNEDLFELFDKMRDAKYHFTKT